MLETNAGRTAAARQRSEQTHRQRSRRTRCTRGAWSFSKYLKKAIRSPRQDAGFHQGSCPREPAVHQGIDDGQPRRERLGRALRILRGLELLVEQRQASLRKLCIILIAVRPASTEIGCPTHGFG